MSIIYDSVLHKLRENTTVQGAYIAKGNVSTYQDLPDSSTVEPGWTYHIESGDWADNEFYWTGSSWENLGPLFVASNYVTQSQLASAGFLNSSQVAGMIGSGALTITSGGSSFTFGANQASNTALVLTQVNDPEILILQGGISKGSFTLNQAGSAIIELDSGGGGGGEIDSWTVSRMISSALANSVGRGGIEISSYEGTVIGAFNVNQNLDSMIILPEIGSGILTISQGGVSKGSFNANQNSASTIELDAPLPQPTYDGSAVSSFSAGPNVSMSRTEQEVLVISATDTSYPVIVSGATITSIAEGDNVTLGVNGGIMTINASGGGGAAVTYGGSPVSSIVSGTNASMAYDQATGALTIGAIQPDVLSVVSAAGYVTSGADVSIFNNNAGYASSGDIPTSVSQLDNDMDFIQSGGDITDLVNDAGYITAAALPTVGSGTLTIYQDNQVKGTFNANAGADASITLDGGGKMPVVAIPAASATYTLESGKKFTHVPSAATTYTLPAVTDAAVVNECILDVNFANVTSASFVTAGGSAITPLQQPTIHINDVISYICTYSPLQSAWNIMPVPLAPTEMPFATITIGPTTTGQPGTSASVVNTGTASAAILEFTIPQGPQGTPGQDGTDGIDGQDGQDAPEVKIQYSTDNSNWHSTFGNGDCYIRYSTDDGTTWSSGMKFIGDGVTPLTDITTLEGASVSISPGNAYDWTLTSDGTLNATGGSAGFTGDSIITIHPGSYTVTAGTNLAICGTLIEGISNMCAVRWTGTIAQLYVMGSTSTPTIAVGTVTEGTPASVTNTGTNTAAVFDFVLPKGDPAPATMIRYSADNVNWHSTFADGDIYIQYSTNNGTTWSSGMQFVGQGVVPLTDITTLTGTIVTVSPGNAYEWAVLDNSTLNISGGEEGKTGDSIITLVLGNATVTAGPGLTLSEELAPNATHVCAIRWTGTTAVLWRTGTQVVNNATLTITQGGVSKGTFTANASQDVTIALDAGGGGGGVTLQQARRQALIFG